MKQLLLDMGVESVPDFASFILSDDLNRLAVQHLQRWLGVPLATLHAAAQGDDGALGAARNAPLPTYLWGENGSGKTHLLHAVKERLREQGCLIGWLGKHVQEEQPFQEQWSAVLMDDIDELSATQLQTAFAWFEQARFDRKWILAAGRHPPARLLIREDLRSRLAWGHLFEIKALGDAQCRAVLRRAADDRGIYLRDEVMDYILRRFSRDLGSLMRLLGTIDHYSLVHKRQITIPLIKRMMDEACYAAGGAAV